MILTSEIKNQVEVFATCPQAKSHARESYTAIVSNVSRCSERYGCTGILVYTDNSQLDPWLVAQIIIQNTEELCPLVAVQPIYAHPYTVAKMVSSLAHLYRRRLYLNMVAGGFKNDLAALNDVTPHDRRYARLVEYTTIIKRLLCEGGPVSYRGEFYTVEGLNMVPPLPPELIPGIFISGSSEAGLAAARAIGATAVTYPTRAADSDAGIADQANDLGIRIGIIAREESEEAWQIAHQRFPEDRRGELTHQLAMKTSDSVWHKRLSDTPSQRAEEKSPYWMLPFQTYKTFCPYLVGSYEEVAHELASYIQNGVRKVILDIPADEEELRHTSLAFQEALRGVASVPALACSASLTVRSYHPVESDGPAKQPAPR
jgi:alkanesulfonate monooxygenase